MKNIPILPIMSWIYIIATFVPIYLLISEHVQIPVIDFLISIFISGIPLVNVIVGIIGAVSVMEIPVIGAILFYFAPQIIFLCLFFIFMSKEK